ncbi:MAG: gluconate 2-dehydrogenase subunit 3 family protein [Chlorobia bacterium]|nr:gluconate 2-dehydrogenase subunit 3 family protein [Fimbriimonadaceae bacterium]
MPIPDPLLPTLRAALARLIPADQDLGALELGAEAFIHERIAENPGLLVVYERGLTALADQDFTTQTPDQQDEILRNAETRYPEFIPVIANHAIEAVYTHPEGLRMVGFKVTL